MNINIVSLFFKLATSSTVVRRAKNVAIIVGVILNLINQPEAIFSLSFESINILKFCLTFMVPYVVSSYSSVMSKLHFEVGEVAPMNAKLKCKKCDDEVIEVNKGEVVPVCKACPDKTKWVIVNKGNPAVRKFDTQFESMALFAEYNPAPVFRFKMDGAILMSNPAANKFFGRDIEGVDVHQLSKQFVSYDFKSMIDRGELTHFVEYFNGRTYQFEMRGVPKYGVCHVYGADITDLVKTQEENIKLTVAIEQSSNAIMITNTKGDIEFVNQAYQEITGYNKEEVLGKNPRFQKTDHLGEDDYKAMWDTITKGDTWKGEFHNYKKNGGTYWEEATITPIFDSGQKIVSYMAIKENISARKQVRQELKSMALFAEMNPEPVFRFNKQGLVMKANPAANQAFEQLNIQGHYFYELLPDCADIDYVSLIKNADILTVEEQIHGKDFRFIMRGIPELDVCQIYGSDVTLRKKAEEKVRKQNDNIAKSIAYASRIQNAILPSKDRIARLMPEHFILFKPRDVVSGDFYWMAELGNKLVIAAADCTGHGVPGAFMSMLGVSFLNEIVNNNEGIHANEILTKLRERVKSTLAQSGKEAKDGMDIALVIVNYDTMVMEYSGAYNPLILFRNGELIQIKADKMPIGVHLKEKPTFTNHIVPVIKDDVFYLFSDGYHDQFGGKNKMKFSSKAFRSLLGDIHKEPLASQLIILEDKYNDWKGDIGQIDDVLVIGGKI